MFVKEVNVTGLSKHEYALNYQRIKSSNLILIRDTKNQYDKKATGVFLDEGPEYKKIQLGWIPKEHNQGIARLLDEGKELKVKVLRNIINIPVYTSDLYIEVKEVVDSSKVAKDYNEFMGFKEYSAAIEPEFLPNSGHWSDATKTEALRLAASSHIDCGITNSNIRNRCNEIDLKVDHIINTSDINLTKGNKEMSTIDKVVTSNKFAATNAAYNEGARIALNQITKLAAKNAPLMVRGYLDTPFGKLVVANLALAAVGQFRPNDAKLAKLANAAVTVAYQEVYQSFDIEKMISEFVENGTVKKLLESDTE